MFQINVVADKELSLSPNFNIFSYRTSMLFEVVTLLLIIVYLL